jgi:hypothetical protein
MTDATGARAWRVELIDPIAPAAATMAEVAWALVYLTAGEVRPWIWLIPLAAGGAVAVTAPRWPVA